MFGHTLSRYIAGRTLRGIGLAFLVVTAIITLVDFVESSRNLGTDADFSPLQLLQLTLLKVPKLIEQTIPFVVLFGVMGALYGMNRRSELIVMRAAGLSAWRFLRPAVAVTATLGILWAALFNPFASKLMSQYDARTAAALGGETTDSDVVWLREGTPDLKRIWRADAMELSTRTLIRPMVMELAVEADGTTTFVRRYDAEVATLTGAGFWRLTDVRENAPGQIVQRSPEISLPTDTTAQDLRDQSGEVVDPPFWQIGSEIAAAEAAGFSALGLRLQLNKLLALPFVLVAMTFIAAGVSMSLTRSGGTLRLLVTGAALGFAVFFADSVMSAFGEVAALPILLASWAVPIMVLLLGVAHLAHTEDG